MFWNQAGGENNQINKITVPNNRGDSFYLSNSAQLKMNHADAARYCRARGATLPTKEQLEVLSRAMGKRPGSRYDTNAIGRGAEKYLDKHFWSSTMKPQSQHETYVLRLLTGNVISYYYNENLTKINVLCVWNPNIQVPHAPAQAHEPIRDLFP